MSEKKEYGQVICEAIDTIVSERLSGIKFDTTILCTIVDDKDKAQGKYIVSYSDAKFEAYAMGDTKYSKNNNVYVQIPQGDWNEQKFIIAKKTDKEKMPITYQDPFDMFVDITGNIIEYNDNTKKGLAANGGIIIDNENNVTGGFGEGEFIELWSHNSEDQGKEAFTKYTRLGIQAQFRSWLAEEHIGSGSYGLKLCIDAEEENSSTGLQHFDAILDASDMIGDPYAFDTYYQQEKLFDISGLYNIKNLTLYFYQKNDFKNNSGKEYINTYKDENLFVKDVYISFGYDVNTFDEDSAIVYTLDSHQFDKDANPQTDNHRKVELRWIHRMDNGTIKAVSLNDDIDYDITWYKYKLGAYPHTPQAGADWIPLSTQEIYKRNCSTVIVDNDWNIYNETADPDYYRRPGFNYTWLIPKEDYAEEKIKAIISYKVDDKPVYITSDTLIFTNQKGSSNQQIVDQTQALQIVCEDGSRGNYYIYDQGGNVINPESASEIRTFKAYYKGAPLINAESIKWILPYSNSMIKLQDDYYKDDGYFWSDDGERITIERYGDNGRDYQILNTQQYKIDSSFSEQKANNTIQCQIVKDTITYTATKELNFGHAGSNGTDYTLKIDFEDGITAIPCLDSSFFKTVGKDKVLDEDQVDANLVNKNGEYKLTASLCDFENNPVSFTATDLIWSFDVAPANSALSFNGSKNDEKQPIGTEQTLLVDYSSLKMGQLYIVSCSLTWRDNQTLTAYLPIPIYKYQPHMGEIIEQPAYITGATKIIYHTTGEPDYSKEPYHLYWFRYQKGDKRSGIEKDNLAWEICMQGGGAPTVKLNEKQVTDPYAPTYNNSASFPQLKIIEMYIDGSGPYGIQCKQGNDVIWTQPIFMTLRRYPNSMVNAWDGKTLSMDEEKGSIMATAISAGKKNDNNTFSGVMMGNWYDATKGDIDPSVGEVGLYGFHNGEVSFAFLEDGTGYIGKAGKGRINLNGDKSTINSEAFRLKHGGMQIDLDDGILEMYKYIPGKEGVDTRNNAYSIKLDASTNSTVPLQIGSNFSVSWDGTLFANGGYFYGSIDATYGTLGDMSVEGTLTGGVIEGATIKGSTIYFGVSEGEVYEICNDKGEVLYTRTYASKLTKGESVKLPNGKNGLKIGQYVYVYSHTISTKDAISLGKMGMGTGDDNVGKTATLELIANNSEFPMVLKAARRILISSYGQLEDQKGDSWVTLASGPDWENGRVMVNSDGWGSIDIISRKKKAYGGLLTIDVSKCILNASGKARGDYTDISTADGHLTVLADEFHMRVDKDKQFGIYARFA